VNLLLSRIRQNWPLLFILLLSAFLRLFRLIDYTEFLGDQARDLIIIRNFLHSGDLFFIGPQTSIGNMYLGPFFYYLISPALLLSSYHPIGPAAFIAILGVATVYLVYLVTKTFFDKSSALVAALLYALSPVVIKYSTFSWNPNIMPFFSLLFIFSIYNFVSTKSPKYLLWASLSLILCLNSHYLALLLIPPAAFFLGLFFYRQRHHLGTLPSMLVLPAILLLLSLLPQILFDFKHDGQNVKAIIQFFCYRETTVNIKPYKAIPHLIPLFNQYTARLISGKNDNAGILFSAFILVGLFVYYFKTRQQNIPFKSRLLFLTAFLFFGIFGLSLYKQHIYDHYFGIIFPLGFIVFAFLVTRLLTSKLKFFAYLLILSAALFSLWENPFRYAPNRQVQTTQAIVDSIINDSQNQPFNLALLAKQNYDDTYRYFFFLADAPLKDAHSKITDQLYVICEPWQIECQPINHPQWQIASFGWAKIDKQWVINGITVFRLIHTQ
jgi:4-amino-4-deoxy-L-arabinose transferase-like glycosyltransferase